ncbi:MAG TPA: hypothetical protein VKP03_01770 [Patescibacteria group bacterium]|nr:hypothetical protein [Patescibacteria group bacterium]
MFNPEKDRQEPWEKLIREIKTEYDSKNWPEVAVRISWFTQMRAKINNRENGQEMFNEMQGREKQFEELKKKYGQFSDQQLEKVIDSLKKA